MRNFTQWSETEGRAKNMNLVSLAYAYGDCLAAAACGLDESYYHDEASVYSKELRDRGLALNGPFVAHYIRRAAQS